MPWNHCGTSIKDDVRSCPECGAPKQAWTTKLDKTRTFQIGGDYDPAQAETLEDAQESGSPFCEDCQAADNPADDPDEEEEENDDYLLSVFQFLYHHHLAHSFQQVISKYIGIQQYYNNYSIKK